jgi:hypothetical protein
MNQPHYPSFNVLDELDAWDDHPQSIVSARLSPSKQSKFLNAKEAKMLLVICGLLMNDSSSDVLLFVIDHFDETLQSSPGESQRKAGIPPGKDLIRLGLQSLEKTAENNYSASFQTLDPIVQIELIQAISEGKMEPSLDFHSAIQQAFFQKVMSLTIESYCSHPKVWSEIGYAGPAYPRGYVRAQLGQLDPWEAKTEQ